MGESDNATMRRGMSMRGEKHWQERERKGVPYGPDTTDTVSIAVY